MTAHDDEFTRYYAARGATMRATAYLLCGDWHTADDLVQTAFIKLYRAWDRVNGHDRMDGYLRRTLVRAYLDHRRRPWRRESTIAIEQSLAWEPASTTEGPTEDRQILLRALAAVPPRQRAVLVLRYWEDMSEADTAELLGCSPGTVKSQAARGLANLRARLSHVEAFQ
jgi:RNA polymerase sigma-70 factor (sigma-E family)